MPRAVFSLSNGTQISGAACGGSSNTGLFGAYDGGAPPSGGEPGADDPASSSSPTEPGSNLPPGTDGDAGPGDLDLLDDVLGRQGRRQDEESEDSEGEGDLSHVQYLSIIYHIIRERSKPRPPPPAGRTAHWS